MDLPAPASTAVSHPIWTIVVVGVAFGALVLLDAIVAALTGRGLYQRLIDLVARMVAPLNRAAPPAAATAAEGNAS